MSRPLPNAADHLPSLKKHEQQIVQKAVQFVSSFSVKNVDFFKADYDEIVRQLKGSGFDVARGFKINNARARRYSE